MKKILLLVVLALAGVAAWYYWETRPKPDNEVAHVKPMAATQHGDAFNQSVNGLLQDYFNLSERLVSWDSAAVAPQVAALQKGLAALRLDELKQDSVVYTSAILLQQKTAAAVGEMAKANGLEQQRRQFHQMSQHLYDLLRTLRFDAQPVYLQECPMAFNDDETGHWLSNTAEIRNPYLGLHHPKYKSGMLKCGETKDSLIAAK